MKKNYYELSKSEEAKYRVEYSQTVLKNKNKDISLTIIGIVILILLVLSLLLFIGQLGSLFENIIDKKNINFTVFCESFICLILTSISFCSLLYIGDLRFKRWLKIKHGIEY